MEYLLVLFEYFWINKGRFITHFCIALLLGGIVYFCSNDSLYLAHSINFHNNILSLLGVLIGFSISILTILLSLDNRNIREAKKENYGKVLFGKTISLFESVIIGLAYVVILQALLLIGNFIYPIFIDIKALSSKIWFSCNLAITIYVILLLMRTMLDFYFIITKKEDAKPKL